MADTQTLSDPFKLPKGNTDLSGKIPGQKDYNKNSQTKNTYKVDIPTRAGQTTGANENNPVAVYRVGVTQPIGTITSQSGFTPNPTYYSGVSAAEEKIRKAEQRAVREQTVEINKQVIKPTAEKAKIKPPIKNNDAASDSQSADKTTPAPDAGTKSVDSGEAVGPTSPTGGYGGALIYPEDLGATSQDRIKFDMLDDKKKIVGTAFLAIPSGISDTNACNWGENSLNAAQQMAAAVAFKGITKGVGAGVEEVGKSLEKVFGDDKSPTGLAAFFAATAVGTDAAALLSRTSGIVLNPNLQLLFNGPTLRPFSFTFKMSARSQSEAKIIITILNFFKRGMSSIKTKSNLFLKAPHTFKIQYRHLGGVHPYIGKIKECALQSITTNYTPEGQYATYVDGYMVSYEIQMQFQELEPIFNNDYESTSEIGY